MNDQNGGVADLETEIFSIIRDAGEARGLLYEALEACRRGDSTEGEKLYAAAGEKLTDAHRVQAALVSRDLAEGVPISLLLVHTQDQLMTTMSEQTLLRELMSMADELHALRAQVARLES